MASIELLDNLLADENTSDDANDFVFPYGHPLNVNQLPLPDAETIKTNLKQTCKSDNMNKELQKLANQIEAGLDTNQITSMLLKLMVITTMATTNASSHVDLTTLVNKFEQKALNLNKAITAILHLKQETMFGLTDEVLGLIGKDQTTNEYKELSETLKARIKPTIKEIKQVETFYYTSFYFLLIYLYIHTVIKAE